MGAATRQPGSCALSPVGQRSQSDADTNLSGGTVRSSGGILRTVTISTDGQIAVGPTVIARNIPRWARIAVTGVGPYDVAIQVNWDDDEQRLVAEDVRITRRLDGPAVRATAVAGLKFGQLIEEALIAEVLDDRG